MKHLLLALAACAAASSASASTVVFDFAGLGHHDDLGTTETYSSSGLSIVASGFDGSNSATDLWGKHDGGDEHGLGLKNDGDHEIAYHKGYVQLDVSDLIGQVLAGSTLFGTNSTTDGETWSVYGSNSAHSLGSLLAHGTTEGNHLLPDFGDYQYYDFVSTATAGGKNFLLTSLTVTPTPAPEPASWAMMLLGFGGLGALLRHRRAGAEPVSA